MAYSILKSGQISTLFPLVRGIVSRVQTALPSIRNRLRNLRPGFHPIYQKEGEGEYPAGFRYVRPYMCMSGRTYCESQYNKRNLKDDRMRVLRQGALRFVPFTVVWLVRCLRMWSDCRNSFVGTVLAGLFSPSFKSVDPPSHMVWALIYSAQAMCEDGKGGT